MRYAWPCLWQVQQAWHSLAFHKLNPGWVFQIMHDRSMWSTPYVRATKLSPSNGCLFPDRHRLARPGQTHKLACEPCPSPDVLNEALHPVKLPLGRLSNADLRPDGFIVLAHLVTHHIVLCLHALTHSRMGLLQAADLHAKPASGFKGGLVFPTSHHCLHNQSLTHSLTHSLARSLAQSINQSIISINIHVVSLGLIRGVNRQCTTPMRCNM